MTAGWKDLSISGVIQQGLDKNKPTSGLFTQTISNLVQSSSDSFDAMFDTIDKNFEKAKSNSEI